MSSSGGTAASVILASPPARSPRLAACAARSSRKTPRVAGIAAPARMTAAAHAPASAPVRTPLPRCLRSSPSSAQETPTARAIPSSAIAAPYRTAAWLARLLRRWASTSTTAAAGMAANRARTRAALMSALCRQQRRHGRVNGAGARWTGGVDGGPADQGPEAPVAPSTTFTAALRWWPATAVTWYSPGRTRRAVPVQPGDEVFRSHERRRTAGVFLLITTMLDPSPLTQSAELHTRWPETVTTTDTNLTPMLNRHGCLSSEVA